VSRPNLIVLGGGEDQVPAYLEGRRLGYRVIGVDQRPDALGADLADEFLCLTTREPEAIAKRLGPIEVAAVISPASDAAQASVAALSRHYRTAFQPSPKAVLASEDKSYFHAVVEGLGFPHYRHVQSGDSDTLIEAAARLTYPLVVKPTDSSGSKGLGCVRDPADLPAAIADARKHSFRGEAIIEELVVGDHYSVECFARAGRPEFTVVTARTLTPPPEMISVSHLVPADLGAEVRDRLHDMIAAILAALDHRAGPVNLDFIVDAAGAIHFVEMGARLGGNGMPLLVRHAFGLNTVEAAIRLAAGELLDLTAHVQQRVVLLHILTTEREGILRAVDGAAETRDLPNVADLKLFKAPGERVHPYTQAGHKLGYLIVAADTRDALSKTLDAALNTLRFVVEPDTSPRETTA
jgi:biotin carboxylase